MNVVTEVNGELADLAGEAVHVSKSGCQGFCQMGPLVSVEPDGILYCKVREEDVTEIVEKTLKNGEIIERLTYKNPADGSRCRGRDDIPFYKKQGRDVLKACGSIDPEDINEYIAGGGYAAARKAYTEMTPEQVCEEIEHSGLRGSRRRWVFDRLKMAVNLETAWPEKIRDL